MRISIYIDGNNFYKSAKDLLQESNYSFLKFNYSSFCQWLAKDNQLVETTYYIGAIRRFGDEKSEKMYQYQQKLFAYLAQQGIKVVLGSIIKHPDGIFHEKGVDVKIAVDMIRGARENLYDEAVLISSDTDLVPAIEEVHNFNKKIIYIGFPRNQSFGLTKIADDYLVLRKDELMSFFPKRLL